MSRTKANEANAGRDRPPLAAGVAWRHALGITLVGCIVLGPGFALLPAWLGRHTDNLFVAGAELQLVFAVLTAVILVGLQRWQKADGSSLGALGFARPASWGMLLGGALLGLAWTGFNYLGSRRTLPGVDLTAMGLVRVALAPVGLFMAVSEETMMRGFFMTELHRAGVRPWLQVLASAVCSALYHSLGFLSQPVQFVESFAGSAVLFGALAWLYARGRSLTPVILAHGLINVLGEPYLLMTLIVLAMHV